eukprot:scaffold1457_cov111-Skeletonema_dohrnii-CCMP3373.AAC.8
MAAEIAREIIAQSQGGGKMAFKFSPPQGSGIVVRDSLLLSSSKDADKHAIYNVHLTKDDQAFDINYSQARSACDFVTSIMRSKMGSGMAGAEVKIVLYKKSSSEFVALAELFPSCSIDSLSCSIQKKLHLLDVIDVVEG